MSLLNIAKKITDGHVISAEIVNPNEVEIVVTLFESAESAEKVGDEWVVMRGTKWEENVTQKVSV